MPAISIAIRQGKSAVSREALKLLQAILSVNEAIKYRLAKIILRGL